MIERERRRRDGLRSEAVLRRRRLRSLGGGAGTIVSVVVGIAAIAVVAVVPALVLLAVISVRRRKLRVRRAVRVPLRRERLPAEERGAQRRRHARVRRCRGCTGRVAVRVVACRQALAWATGARAGRDEFLCDVERLSFGRWNAVFVIVVE